MFKHYMVTGGWDSARKDLDTTEIYREGNWQLIPEKLPSKKRLTELITINNRVLLFGNSKNKPYNEALGATQFISQGVYTIV